MFCTITDKNKQKYMKNFIESNVKYQPATQQYFEHCARPPSQGQPCSDLQEDRMSKKCLKTQF